MKKFTLIILFIFLIIRIDVWECKFGLPMDFKNIPESHPMRQTIFNFYYNQY